MVTATSDQPPRQTDRRTECDGYSVFKNDVAVRSLPFGPEGQRKLAGGANHRCDVTSKPPRRGGGDPRGKCIRRPLRGGWPIGQNRWLAPPANFLRPSGPKTTSGGYSISENALVPKATK